jgi:hypothetical protein
MVLGCLGTEEPLFSQGTLFNFRQRMIAKGLDQELFDKTVALARETGGFSATYLRAAFDASPLWGAGRVGRHLQSHRPCRDARRSHGGRAIGPTIRRRRCPKREFPVVAATSIKTGLDIDWDDPDARKKGPCRSSSGKCRPSVAGSIASSKSSWKSRLCRSSGRSCRS